ncbi:MAG: dTDP-4-dehydrorhamnose 3,5-epimerase [Cellvibrio sp.]|uniref:dTDP-4-dehydrorhamnose 3,5-epimerase n=1 Tax=Cellvibrio sp. TaxID=1965322 RepID=UPI0027171C2E|nr:dTDP-4-dehydrorhamnose 3,5-epimerase [Cellvibrio sp.]
MGKMSLNDISITPLACISTPGGDVLHAMKQSDAGYVGFGEAYFSWVSAGAVKAWKRHSRMTMNVIVPVGLVRFVFYLDGADAFRVEQIGVDRYTRLTVPPGIWFGFQGLTAPQSLVLNISSIPHDPNEVQRLPLSDIKYAWN